MDDDLLRALVPQVIGVLVRRGNDFATAEDAVQDALVEAVRVWPQAPPTNPRAWLVTVAQRRLVDVRRSEAARRRREEALGDEPDPGPTEQADDALLLLTLCCHPSLSPTSAVALTLRAVGGLTTAQVADAFLVPQATMAQRISRAKATVRDVPLDRPGDLAAVLRVLYLVFHTGHRGQVDLAAEAIRLTRQLHPGQSGARGAGAAGADAAAPRPRRRALARGPARAPGPPGPRPVGHRRDRGAASRSSRRRSPRGCRGSTRCRPPSQPSTTTPRRGGDRLAAGAGLVRRPGGARGQPDRPARPPRRARPRRGTDRGARRARRPRGGGRRRPRSSTPCAATCSSWPATSTTRRRRTPGLPASRPACPSATTSRGARRRCGRRFVAAVPDVEE